MSEVARRIVNWHHVGVLLGVSSGELLYIENSIPGACIHLHRRRIFNMLCHWYYELSETDRLEATCKDQLRSALKTASNNEEALKELDKVSSGDDDEYEYEKSIDVKATSSVSRVSQCSVT